MFDILQVLTVLLVAVAMALALAHALELPGKMRLSKDAYYAMQPIYYPGFTIGGFAEPAGLILTIILLFFKPLGTADFWLILAALLGLISMQATYWLFIHPVNKFWLEGQKLSGLSSGFFSFGTSRSRAQNETRPADWTALRDRWEYSHVARAGLALTSLTLLVIAISDGS
ncbi:MAG TPA: anthrone oxygenase family protein [Candidatus Binatia bacterium]